MKTLIFVAFILQGCALYPPIAKSGIYFESTSPPLQMFIVGEDDLVDEAFVVNVLNRINRGQFTMKPFNPSFTFGVNGLIDRSDSRIDTTTVTTDRNIEVKGNNETGDS